MDFYHQYAVVGKNVSIIIHIKNLRISWIDINFLVKLFIFLMEEMKDVFHSMRKKKMILSTF